jgi:serine/threonine protein kinase
MKYRDIISIARTMLETGTRLGPYEIVGALGAGGMGEVWRATDTKLGRQVALKVLPEEFANDPERYARFEREAKVLASLNHPNIAHLYGLETVEAETGLEDRGPRTEDRESAPGREGDSVPGSRIPDPGVHFLVMELVEGEDLSDRIARGPISVDEALPIALQVAEALEAAHEQGIVHRDLKPANVKIRPDGTVKVLDFGLAKAWQDEGSDASSSLSPTLTRHATVEGLILGTAAYMSPEQAAGKQVDRRADIWAFGVVLWEMLTGSRLFEGESVTHILASVLKDEPDLSALPKGVPDRLTRLIGRCLRQDPTRRIQAMGDARVTIQEIQEQPDDEADWVIPAGGEIPAAQPWARRIPWLVAVGLAAALVSLIIRPTPDESSPAIEAVIPAPPGAAFDIRAVSPGAARLSPDGTKLVFSAQGEDRATQLWVHEISTGTARVLEDTKGGHYPFWSPDSRRVGFFTQSDRTLKTIDADGGPAMTVCEAVFGKGGTWSADGSILFAPGWATPIHVVSEDGGDSRPVTVVNEEVHNSHRHPRTLPDGRRFLFFARGAVAEDSAVMLGDLDGGEPRLIMRSDSQAEYVDGHLIYVREGSMMARPVDLNSFQFTGPARPIAEDVIADPGSALAQFSATERGLLVYHSGIEEAAMPILLQSRSGEVVKQVGDAARYQHPRVSQDGYFLAVSRSESAADEPDIWLGDLTNDLWSRFTLSPSEDIYAVWEPHGDGVIFASNRSGPHDLYRKAITGTGHEELILSTQHALLPTDVTPDGRHVLIDQFTDGAGIDIWLLDRESGDAAPLRQSSSNEAEGQVSPDGRWMTYQSDETGRLEIYVTPFPDAGRSWQISQTGGMYPNWRADGGELAYVDLDGMLHAVPISTAGDAINIGRPTALFRIDPPKADGPAYDALPDLGRFVVNPSGVATADNTLKLIVNWQARLDTR